LVGFHHRVIQADREEDRFDVLAVTYMSRVMSGLPQTLGHRRRESIIDQKPQGLVTKGISRSRTASAA
jgi:hypothetical protein